MTTDKSDILIIVPNALTPDEVTAIKTVLMETDRSVLVHLKDGQDRILLVYFSPTTVTTAQLLQAARTVQPHASMVGG